MMVPLRRALEDFLKQHGLTIADVLDAMDETKEGALESLRKRAHLSDRDIKFIEKYLSARDINLLVLALQVFYLSYPGGLYRNLLISPTREEVVGPDGKVTREGLLKVMSALGIRPKGRGLSVRSF